MGHERGSTTSATACSGSGGTVPPMLLHHFLVLVPDKFPSHVLLTCIVSGYTFVGITGAHKVSRHLADSLVGCGIGPHKIQFRMEDFDGFFQRSELGDDSCNLAEEPLFFQRELAQFFERCRTARITLCIVFIRFFFIAIVIVILFFWVFIWVCFYRYTVGRFIVCDASTIHNYCFICSFCFYFRFFFLHDYFFCLHFLPSSLLFLP
mmetsp:Transcript_20836/g.44249  ORF Transcript_20836/g.44249 Transcript_20836/m.44249 type:complete len:207 (-) Transcript_20836:808-1428(-)